jgi:hypothetical protein
MTGEPDEPVPDPHDGERDLAGQDPPSLTMPPWIPILIGAAIVAIAAVAVYTGLHYRQPSLNPAYSNRRSNPSAAVPEDQGAPGEPQPGASRILHGSSGENVPMPSTDPTTQHSRIRISGGGSGGVTSSFHTSVRRGLLLKVDPSEAMVYINDQPIGTAQQFSNEDEAYEFADPGNFTVRLVAPGFQDAVFQVTADPEAKDELGVIDTKLQRTKPGSP